MFLCFCVFSPGDKTPFKKRSYLVLNLSLHQCCWHHHHQASAELMNAAAVNRTDPVAFWCWTNSWWGWLFRDYAGLNLDYVTSAVMISSYEDGLFGVWYMQIRRGLILLCNLTLFVFWGCEGTLNVLNKSVHLVTVKDFRWCLNKVN